MKLQQIILLMFFPFAVLSQPKMVEKMVIDRGMMLNFVPEEAFFIVSFDDRVTVRIPAQIMPPLRKNPGSINVGMWWFGAKVRVPVGSQVEKSFGFVKSKDGQVAPFQYEEVDLNSGDHLYGSTERLAALVNEQRKELAVLLNQVGDKNAQLVRLRADAELIGNFARIIDAKEDLSRIEREKQSLSQDLPGLEYFIKLASTYPPPGNSIGRVQQLSKQISELADASTRAERGELVRRYSGDKDVSHKLAVLEQTRGLDLADLNDELERLRAERNQLEATH